MEWCFFHLKNTNSKLQFAIQPKIFKKSVYHQTFP